MKFHAFLVLLGTFFLLPLQAIGAELTEAKFTELLKTLQPDAEDPWLTIPWKIDLLDAQRTAAKEHKPIFIWAMDGHPLGCT